MPGMFDEEDPVEFLFGFSSETPDEDEQGPAEPSAIYDQPCSHTDCIYIGRDDEDMGAEGEHETERHRPKKKGGTRARAKPKA